MDPIGGPLLLQVLLIAVNAVFTCAETALVSLSDKKTEKQAEEGDKKAALLSRMLQDPDRYLSAAQIITTLAGFLGAAFASFSFAGGLGHWLYADLGLSFFGEGVWEKIAIVLIMPVLSYFSLVLGVLVPKRIAARRPEKTARAVCRIMHLASALVRPAVFLLTVSANGILRLLRIDPYEKDEEVTEEEIRQMVDAGEEDGNIESNEKEMIENIFEFNNTTAYDVMVHRTEMTAVDIDESPEELLKIIEETGYSRFPVYEDSVDSIVGILSARSFLIDRCAGGHKTLKELIYEPYFVPETVTTDALLNEMQARKSHMAIVLDEFGGTSGLVTMEDLLEQIVGDIYDETDDQNEEQEIRKLSEDTYRMAGSAPLEQIEEELDIDFPAEDDELSTLSGLIFSRFTTIPADGEKPVLDIDRLHIEVEEITEHRVAWARVTLLPVPEKEEQ